MLHEVLTGRSMPEPLELDKPISTNPVHAVDVVLRHLPSMKWAADSRFSLFITGAGLNRPSVIIGRSFMDSIKGWYLNSYPSIVYLTAFHTTIFSPKHKKWNLLQEKIPLILIVNTIYLFCYSRTNINTLFPTEIKHSWRGLLRSAILDFIPSFTQYHSIPKSQQQYSLTQYHQCFNENLFQSIIKKGLYQHLSFIPACRCWELSITLASWHIVSPTHTEKNVAQLELLMCLLGKVIRGR